MGGWMARASGMAVVAVVILASGPARADSSMPGPYQTTGTMKVPGEGRWDYAICDASANLLYVTRSTHVMVIDIAPGAAGKVVADIPDTPGVHGVALAPEARRGFTSNGKDGTVTVFDLKTHRVLGKVAAAEDADCIIYDPASRRVLAMCGDANAAVPIPVDIDPATGKADAPVDLGGKPEYAVADGKGHVYVNLVDKSEVVELDTSDVKEGEPIQVMAHWSLAPGQHPTGLSMDRTTRRLFSGCRNKTLVVMDADNGKVIKTFPIGAGVDATAFDNGNALASCGDGTLTVVKEEGPDSFDVAQTVTTAKGARTMAVNSATHVIYMPTAQMGPAPAATDSQPHPKPAMIPGTFELVVVGRP